ncbi:MAG: TadE/TadG family type IV pilus assembly protein [Novosphingobium sp.]|nr:TadE/TadG family type IV pilus assembly protein [Novosphingobium sp.]
MTPCPASTVSRTWRDLRATVRKLLRDRDGMALVEFAYSLPLLLLLGLGGVEVANYSIAHMRVSQLAVSLADNASRAKQEIVAGVPHMRELDVNDAFEAAELQSGKFDIEGNGRMILSSLEVNSDGGQWIHWQRCIGDAPYSSSYGVEGDGATGTSFPGMGPSDRRITSEPGFAIMFAEVVYDYKPVAFPSLIPDVPIRKVAAMYVRDDRDLTQIYNPSPAATVSSCN